MMTADIASELPDSVLDEAFHWAVILGSGTVDRSQRKAFDNWLQVPLNRVAWQRIEIIDRDFAAVRGSASHGRQTLDRVSGRRRNRRLKALAGTLLALMPLLALLLSSLWQPQYATDQGELRAIALDGGAQVQIDGDTSLDIERVAGVTVLQLHHGRILVDSSAAKLADKPQVIAGAARFAPLGTRFVVTSDGDDTDLAVLQGRVRIDANKAPLIEARGGERWHVTAGSISLLPDDGLSPAGWSDGVVEADNAGLCEVVAALGRYHAGTLQCDAAAASLRVTGLFHINNTDAALQALAQSLPLRIERTEAWWGGVVVKVQLKQHAVKKQP